MNKILGKIECSTLTRYPSEQCRLIHHRYHWKTTKMKHKMWNSCSSKEAWMIIKTTPRKGTMNDWLISWLVNYSVGYIFRYQSYQRTVEPNTRDTIPKGYSVSTQHSYKSPRFPRLLWSSLSSFNFPQLFQKNLYLFFIKVGIYTYLNKKKAIDFLLYYI